eukprot:15463648-Alexandrium_andersonii.AAC.1
MHGCIQVAPLNVVAGASQLVERLLEGSALAVRHQRCDDGARRGVPQRATWGGQPAGVVGWGPSLARRLGHVEVQPLREGWPLQDVEVHNLIAE